MKKVFFIFCVLLTLGISNGVFAATEVVQYGYQPIVGIPGMAPSNSLSTEGYVDALYKLSITAAALLAMVKIIWAGVKWTLSDVVTDKGSAKKDIWGALQGLLIILVAVLVLNTINPNLTKLNIFGDAPSLDAIEVAQQGADTAYGINLNYSRLSDEEKAQYVRNCKGVIVQQTIGFNNTVSCYADPSGINARIGDTFDSSIYVTNATSTYETARAQFEQTCFANGGVYNDNIDITTGDTCDASSFTENVKVGDSLSLPIDGSSESDQFISDAVTRYEALCPGAIAYSDNLDHMTCTNDPKP